MRKFAGSTVLPEDPLAYSDVFVVVLRWCAETKALQPSRLGSPQEPLPMIHFLPVENYVPNP